MVLFWFLIGVFGAVFVGLACAWMLACVKFHVAKCDVCACLVPLREGKFQKKTTTSPLHLLLPILGTGLNSCRWTR